MSTNRIVSGAVISLFLLGALLSIPPANAGLLGTDLRPYFSVGPSYSTEVNSHYEVNSGYGVAFGLEAERSQRFSALFRVEWNRMHLRPNPESLALLISDHRTTATWSLGARTYLNTRNRVRSYVDGGVGVGMVDYVSRGGIIPLSLGGLAVTLRVGISSAAPGRPGFFLDSGVEMVVDSPDLIPVRLGVVFP